MADQSKKEHIAISVILFLITIVTLIDVSTDLSAGGSPAHVSLEIFVIAISLAALTWIWTRQISQMKRQIGVSEQRLKDLERDAARWKAEVANVKPGISAAIDQQFSAWQLTHAEQEIARLILKGLTNKEIAAVRSSTEQTIKQQTNAIYRKTGLASRGQLAAFFLEDLF